MQDHPARSDSFDYSQDNANQLLTNANYYVPVFESKVTICMGDEFD